jgi:hypothetical protein
MRRVLNPNFPIFELKESLRDLCSASGITTKHCSGHFMWFHCHFPKFEAKLMPMHCFYIRKSWTALNVRNTMYSLNNAEGHTCKTH